MRVATVTFWTFIVAFFAIDAGAGTDVISNHQAYNQIVVALSTTALVALVFNQIWPKPLEALVGRLRGPPSLSEPDSFMPLRDAARELYEANINGLLGAAARRDTGDGVDPLLWCAYWIAPRFQEIFGRRPPSTKLEFIPPYLFTYAHFEDHGDRLTGGDGGDYVDLCVKRGAFRTVLPGLGEMPASEPG